MVLRQTLREGADRRVLLNGKQITQRVVQMQGATLPTNRLRRRVADTRLDEKPHRRVLIERHKITQRVVQMQGSTKNCAGAY